MSDFGISDARLGVVDDAARILSGAGPFESPGADYSLSVLRLVSGIHNI